VGCDLILNGIMLQPHTVQKVAPLSTLLALEIQEKSLMMEAGPPVHTARTALDSLAAQKWVERAMHPVVQALGIC
jgi:hypothetical protein